jgi:hypothetical protein
MLHQVLQSENVVVKRRQIEKIVLNRVLNQPRRRSEEAPVSVHLGIHLILLGNSLGTTLVVPNLFFDMFWEVKKSTRQLILNCI